MLLQITQRCERVSGYRHCQIFVNEQISRLIGVWLGTSYRSWDGVWMNRTYFYKWTPKQDHSVGKESGLLFFGEIWYVFLSSLHNLKSLMKSSTWDYCSTTKYCTHTSTAYCHIKPRHNLYTVWKYYAYTMPMYIANVGQHCLYLHICLWPMTTTSHRPALSASYPCVRVKLRYRPTAVHVSLTVAPAATGPLCLAHSVCVDRSELLPTLSVKVSRRSGPIIDTIIKML